MNKKQISGLHFLLVPVFSQVLHVLSNKINFTFDGLAAVIGLVATALSYLTILMLIKIGFQDLNYYLDKKKIESSLKTLESQLRKETDEEVCEDLEGKIKKLKKLLSDKEYESVVRAIE